MTQEKSPKNDREKRLAEQLRTNLKRRKAQAKDRQASDKNRNLEPNQIKPNDD